MNINIWAVIVAAVINMVIGSLWYSKLLFAEVWMKETKRKMEDVGSVTSVYLGMALTALVQAVALAVLIDWRSADTVMLGLRVGFAAWLFIGTAYAASYAFEGKTTKLWLINAGYSLLVLLVNGAVLAVWR